MNLAKLLAAGKSFVAAREGGHRYRLNRVSLPKFISPRNPFAPPERAGTPPPERLPASPALEGERRAGERSAFGSTPETGLTARSSARTTRWWQKLKQIFAGRGLRDKSAPGAPWVAPVQRELSLDEIRVVRNDLRDEDIEIVVGRSGTAVRAKNASVSRWGVVGRAWERLSSRFGAVNQS